MLQESHPSVRRFIRFLALPYCYFKYVNWDECQASKLQVIKDFFYIFFKLKYFPDNYSLCRLWEKPKEEWVYYYGSIYDPYQRSKLRKEILPQKYRLIYDDKNICYQLCLANNIPLPKHYGVVSNNNIKWRVMSIIEKEPTTKLIIKPIEGRGGRNIFLAYLTEGNICVQGKRNKVLLNQFVLPSKSVLQEYIKQHENLDKIAKSVNTIRIVTLLTKKDAVIFLGAFMRFGLGDAFVDNTSQGGITVGIDFEKGVLKDKAFDFKSKIYGSHPTSKVNFNGLQIPYWEDVLCLATKVQKRLSYNKLMGQDIAISPTGPILIEINAEYDNVGLEQVYGPILKDKKVREQFSKYDLLINKFQKKLLLAS